MSLLETQAALDILTIAIFAVSASTVGCALAWIRGGTARQKAAALEVR